MAQKIKVQDGIIVYEHVDKTLPIDYRIVGNLTIGIPSFLGTISGVADPINANDAANRSYVDTAIAGSGTVTSVSVVTANGISGSVADPTSTPAITLTLSAITPTSVAASGTVTGSNLSGSNTGDQTITLTGDVTGTGTSSFVTTLADTTVIPGSYTNASITVDSKGRITSASSSAAGGVTDIVAGTNITVTPPLGTGSVTVSVVAAPTISGANITSIPNTALDNSDFTIGSTLISLGDTVTTLTGIAMPTNGTDVATKNYVDNVANSLTWKNAVIVATVANVTLSGTQTIDGVVLVVGNRVLVKAQTDQTTNGIYTVSAGAWTRALDSDTGSEIVNGAVYSAYGTANSNTQWVNTNTNVTIGVTLITYVQFGAAITYAAGTGLLLTGNTFSNTGVLSVAGTANQITATPSTGNVILSFPSIINPTTVAASGTVTGSNLSGTNTGDQTITLTGDVTGSGTGSFATTLTNSGVTPGTFTSVTVNSKGLVTAGANTTVLKTGDTMTGNLTFSGTGLKILGNFSNPTVSSRLLFQTTVSNDNTFVGAIPSANLREAGYFAASELDPDNSSILFWRAKSGQECTISATKSGTGTYLPLNIEVGGAVRQSIDTNGNTTFSITSGNNLILEKASGPSLQYTQSGIKGYSIASTSGDLIFLSSGTTEKLRLDTNGVASFQAGLASTSTATGTIVVVGGVGVSGAIYCNSLTQTSTNRVKTNIENLGTTSIDNFSLLRPVEFDRTDYTAHEFGFIAEEMELLYPDIVGKDADGTVNGINYSKLTVILTAKIQQQQTEIDLLKAQIIEIINLING